MIQNLQKVNTSSFSQGGWTFTFEKSIISASAEIDALQDELGL